MFKIYHIFHLLSLDVVLGAAGGFAFACKVLKQQVSLDLVCALGLGVWVIYLTDHLLDSFIREKSSSPKYRFYEENRRYLFGFLMVLIIGELAILIKILTLDLFMAGILPVIMLLAYFAGQHFLRGNLRRFFPKEVIISIIYITAIWVIPVLQAGKPSPGYLIFTAVHFMLVLSNVLLFSLFEKPDDLMNQKGSSFMVLSSKQIGIVIIMLSFLCLVGSVLLLLILGSLLVVIPFIIIPVVYILEAVFSETDFITRRYAEIADGVFLLFLISFLPNFSI